ncbi:MAG: malate synthase [bacterium]|nr:malate synthase [bacterium]
MTALLDNVLMGLEMLLHWEVLFSAACGVLGGLLLGAIPGLSDIIAIVLLVPFTFYMNPVAGIAMLMGLSKGANFGGSIPAILFNIPGTGQAVITSLDGYPLTKQGKSGKALKTALYSSCLADSTSDCVLFFFAAPVAMLAIMIGPAEFGMVLIFALMLISITSPTGPVLGLVGMVLGLLFGCFGYDPLTGAPRLAFGSDEIGAGIDLVPMALGFFVIAEIIWQMCVRKNKSGAAATAKAGEPEGTSTAESQIEEDHSFTWADFKKCAPAMGRGTLIGCAIGAIPGIGTTVASYLSYLSTKKSSKTPERFGKGAIEGIAAAEAGNNAVNGPNLIPLITLGIPGNLAAALILGAFTMQGLAPGPMFMEQQAPMLYALFIVLFISNIFTLGFGSVVTRLMRKMVSLPVNYVYSAVVAVCLVGSYIIRSNTFDLFYTLGFAVIGLLCRKARIPMLPLLIAYMLGSALELKVRQTLQLHAGDVSVFLTKPISAAFLIASIIVVVFTVYRTVRGPKADAAKLLNQ